ncbi:MAG TPA: glycosyltransferase family 2 protein [Streptosporangiaceae bacterium]
MAVIIPAFGRHDLTRTILHDLLREERSFDIWIVDNLGSFDPGDVSAEIVRPGLNLGWCGGCNYGVSVAWDHGYDAFVLINNDVRLSPAFMDGLLKAAVVTGGDVIGPLYDHNWPHQRGAYRGHAAAYAGRPYDFLVPFIDGTCMLIRRSVFDRIGFLDEQHWPMYGWGCDKDFALRVRAAGGSVWVTERSYLNHLGRQTARELSGYSELEAERENDQGMLQKWGYDWRELLYEEFEGIPRLGMVQEQFMKEEMTSSELMRPPSDLLAMPDTQKD